MKIFQILRNAIKYIQDDVNKARVEKPMRQALFKVADDMKRVKKALKSGDSESLKIALSDAGRDIDSAASVISRPEVILALAEAKGAHAEASKLAETPLNGVTPEQMAKLADLEKQLQRAMDQETIAEDKMVRVAEDYAKQSSALAADPEVAARMKELPSWLKTATKDMAQRVVNPRDLAIIEPELKEAWAELANTMKENPGAQATCISPLVSKGVTSDLTKPTKGLGYLLSLHAVPTAQPNRGEPYNTILYKLEMARLELQAIKRSRKYNPTELSKTLSIFNELAKELGTETFN